MKRCYDLSLTVVSFDTDGSSPNFEDWYKYLPLLLLPGIKNRVRQSNPIDPNYSWFPYDFSMNSILSFITENLYLILGIAALATLLILFWDDIFGVNDADKLGTDFKIRPWDEYWWGASPKAKHMSQSIWQWNNDYLQYKGEVKLKKQDAHFPNGDDPTY
jgi:hypothetical protein